MKLHLLGIVLSSLPFYSQNEEARITKDILHIDASPIEEIKVSYSKKRTGLDQNGEDTLVETCTISKSIFNDKRQVIRLKYTNLHTHFTRESFIQHSEYEDLKLFIAIEKHLTDDSKVYLKANEMEVQTLSRELTFDKVFTNCLPENLAGYSSTITREQSLEGVLRTLPDDDLILQSGQERYEFIGFHSEHDATALEKYTECIEQIRD